MLDELDADVRGSSSVFERDVINGCGDALEITLEWNTDQTDLDLYVIEPSGNNSRSGGSGVSVFFAYPNFLSLDIQFLRPRRCAVVVLERCTQTAN